MTVLTVTAKGKFLFIFVLCCVVAYLITCSFDGVFKKVTAWWVLDDGQEAPQQNDAVTW